MSSPVLNQAARVLKLVQAGTPADQALRESLTQDRHFTDPAGRRAVSRAVFAYFRWWRWLEPKDSLQKQLEAALALQDRFNQNPAAIKPETLAARAVPDWLKDEIAWPEGGAVLGVEGLAKAAAPNGPSAATADAAPKALEGKRPYPSELACLRQFQNEPALWIRAKVGKGESVAQRLGHCTSTPRSPDAFQYTGLKDLYRTPEFQGGEFEIQDLASQFVGFACNPRPGETWWDACAGEGGKTMHLSDLMQNKGLIWASDRSERRLAKLKERAARGKVFNFRAAAWDGGARLPTKTKFDGILVDAPCSGVGTWQRNPHARWTTHLQDVEELATVQASLLNHVAGSLKPGGRLIYSVCTLTRAETTAVVEAFTAAHPELEPVELSGSQPSVSSEASAKEEASNAQRFLWPHDLNANGMFIASWRKK